MRVAVAVSTVFLSSVTVLAQGCPTKPSNLSKPVLSGSVEDPARDIRFEWMSALNGDGQVWEVTNSVCNKGKESLIVVWEKARIYGDAFTPIPPGRPIILSHTLLSEPVASGSPIQYTYARHTADAQTYQEKAATQKSATLYSTIAGAIENRLPPELKRADDPTVWNIHVNFRATRKDKGFQLETFAKTGESLNLLVAIGTPQNKKLLNAYSASNVEAKAVTLKHEVMAKNATFERNAVFDRAVGNDEQYIVVPVAEAAKMSEGIFIEAGTEVEVAPVVLLTKNYVPVMFGSVSIFR